MDQNPPKESRPPINLRIKFRSESVEQFIERYAVDVSRGGIFIRTREPLAVGTRLKLDFQFQNGSPLMAGDGTVVWIRELDPNRTSVPPGMGVRFDKLTPESQAVLEQLLIEKAKRERSGVPGSGSQGAGGIAVRRPSNMFAVLDQAATAQSGATAASPALPATVRGPVQDAPSGPLAAVTSQLTLGSTAAPVAVPTPGSGPSSGPSSGPAQASSEQTVKHETPAYRPLGTARNPFSSVGTAPTLPVQSSTSSKAAESSGASSESSDDDSAAPFGDISEEPTQIAGHLPAFLLSDEDATVANAQSPIVADKRAAKGKAAKGKAPPEKRAASDKGAPDKKSVARTGKDDTQESERRPLPGMGQLDARDGARKAADPNGGGKSPVPATAAQGSVAGASSSSQSAGTTGTDANTKGKGADKTATPSAQAARETATATAGNKRRVPALVVGLTVLVLGATGIFIFSIFSSQPTQTLPSAGSTATTVTSAEPAPSPSPSEAEPSPPPPIEAADPQAGTPPTAPDEDIKARGVAPEVAPDVAVPSVRTVDSSGVVPPNRKSTKPKASRASRDKVENEGGPASAAAEPKTPDKTPDSTAPAAGPAAATPAAAAPALPGNAAAASGKAEGVAPSTPTPTKAEATPSKAAEPTAAPPEGEATAHQIRVTSKPDGADVIVDGQTVGKTPYSVGIADVSGPHSIAVRKDGFEPFEQTISASSAWSKPKVSKGKPPLRVLKISAKLKGIADSAESKSATEPTPASAPADERPATDSQPAPPSPP
ncbi:MAG: TIGR02266 family protein [Deltaproteobacteria bacterium]|nr:TIGR02266 family protein [Deltaproteobacteria bacterium]